MAGKEADRNATRGRIGRAVCARFPLFGLVSFLLPHSSWVDIHFEVHGSHRPPLLMKRWIQGG